MQDIITIIQTVGFPIACAVAMFLMLNQEQKTHKEEATELTRSINDLKLSFAETINNQRSDMVNAINNNTLVIQKLLDRIDEK